MAADVSAKGEILTKEWEALWSKAKTEFEKAVREIKTTGKTDLADDGSIATAGRAWWALHETMEIIRTGLIVNHPPDEHGELQTVKNLGGDETWPEGHELNIPHERVTGYQMRGWKLVTGHDVDGKAVTA